MIPATGASVAAVFRRGPSTRWHIIKWDFGLGVLESGAWLNGHLYPRQSNISADGRLLGYFASISHPHSPSWPESYFAVSKLPWLTALAAWKNEGTWSWGCDFGNAGELNIHGEVFAEKPFHGSWPGIVKITTLHGKKLDWDRGDFRLEKKRGWTEESTNEYMNLLPKRTLEYPHSPFALTKRNELGHRLILVSRGGDFKEHSIGGAVVDYLIDDKGGKPNVLEGVAWADWDRSGRLLIATLKGELQVREHDRKKGMWEVTWSQELNSIKPKRTRSPDWARTWS